MSVSFKELLDGAVSRLRAEKISDAYTDAWLLAEYILGVKKKDYYMNTRMTVSSDKARAYAECVKRRAGHEPLQYITGKQEFMGLSFNLSPDVLIPRQDTETLAKIAVSRIKESGRDVDVLDLCTGSGCLAVSIAKFCDNARVFASDISGSALVAACENAKMNHADVRFIHSDLFCDITDSYDFIVSNPPYVPTAVLEKLDSEIRDHEPSVALDGGEDGLLFYKRIEKEAPLRLKTGGALLLEIGDDQGDAVTSMFKDKASHTSVYKDLSGRDRVVEVSGFFNRKFISGEK